MKILGYEIKKFISKEEQIQDCEHAYEAYKHRVFYEHLIEKDEFPYFTNIGWHIVGRSGRWLMIGSASTKARGCIKKPNFDAMDEVNDRRQYFCYRFISPHHLLTSYHSYKKR